MSKYYKADDVIKAIEEMPNCYNGWSDTYDKAQIIGVLEELPTIEVSEDCISREMVAKRLAELWETEHPEKSYDEWLEIANKWCDYFPPSVVPQVPSEDCISKEYLKSFEYINKGDFNSVETIREWIDNAPSVVPTTEQSSLVRCKDCRWSEPNNEGDYDCKCHIPTFRVPKDGFCNFGERKDNE